MADMTSLPILRSRTARWAVPAVAAVAVIGSRTRWSMPSRPAPTARCRPRTAAQLLVDVSNAQVTALSGTVVETTDLGLPALPVDRRPGRRRRGRELLLAGLRLPHDAGLVRRSRPACGWPCSASSASPTSSATARTSGPGPATTTPPPTGPSPPASTARRRSPRPAIGTAMTPQQAAQAALKAIDPTTQVTTDPTATVAGRPAYELILRPARLPLAGRLGPDRDRRRHPHPDPRPGLRAGLVEPGVPGRASRRSPPRRRRRPCSGSSRRPARPSSRVRSRAPARTRVPGAAPARPHPTSSARAGPRCSSRSCPRAPRRGRPASSGMLGKLPAVSGSWGSGHLLRSALVSAVLTDDGRVAVGAVAAADAVRRARAAVTELAVRTRRPDQALRVADGRGRDRPRGARRRGLRLPRPERLGQDHHDPDAAGASSRPPPGEVEVFGERDAARGRRASCRRSARWSRGRRSTPTSPGRRNLLRLDAADRTADPCDAPHAGSTPRSTGSACWPPPASATAPTRSGCGSGSPSPRALLTPKDLLVLDEPTNGLDPQGTREVRQLVGSLAGDGDHGARLQPPARRGRADVHPPRRDARRAAGRPGLQRGAAVRRRHRGDRRDRCAG